MKKAKKLLALLLAGVLAMGVLAGCSGGSAGPLTKENVTDYIIDYYKAGMGIRLTEDANLKNVAENVQNYVNGKIGDAGYKGMPTQQAFQHIVSDANVQIKKSWLGDLPQTEGYAYSVGYASTDESYKTDLFNQGKTAVTAMTLALYNERISSKEWKEMPEQLPTDGTICVISGKVNGQNCMIAVFKTPISGGGSSSASSEVRGDEGGASSSAASDATAF